MDDGPGEPTQSVRVLLVADVRSPHTWGWVDAVRRAGITVLGADGQPWPDRQEDISLTQSHRGRFQQHLRSFVVVSPGRLKAAGAFLRLLGPALAVIQGWRLRRVVRAAVPDVVHALRIPYEAMMAVAAVPPDVPLAVSIWGNDLTLFAPSNRLVAAVTRRVVSRTDLLIADCQRDLDLASSWGLRPGIPTAVLPGGGGIDLADLSVAGEIDVLKAIPHIDEEHRLVVNPRGVREYVRNDVLLKAMESLSHDIDPTVRFIFVDTARDNGLKQAIASHPLSDRCIVTGKLSRARVLALLKRTEVMASITDHDGTPNSLLEAMAAGAVPVCGDLPSIREWIEPGHNGFLAAIDDPRAVAEALRLSLGLSDAERWAIRAENAQLIATRAERGSTGRKAADQYRRLIGK